MKYTRFNNSSRIKQFKKIFKEVIIPLKPIGLRPFRLSPCHILFLSLRKPKSLGSLKLAGDVLYFNDPYWFLFCFKEIFEEQIYKFNSKTQKPLIIDCGSNIGLSVIYFKHIYPLSKIISFEPDPQIIKILEQNVASYKLENIELHQRALWPIKGNVKFKTDGGVGGHIIEGSNINKTIEVQTIRLNEFLEQPVDFLKIDIEGAEYNVLLDSGSKLTNVDNLFVEYHGKSSEPQKLHEVLDLLSRYGFRYYLKDALSTKSPFISHRMQEYFDIQLNIFAYRN